MLRLQLLLLFLTFNKFHLLKAQEPTFYSYAVDYLFFSGSPSSDTSHLELKVFARLSNDTSGIGANVVIITEKYGIVEYYIDSALWLNNYEASVINERERSFQRIEGYINKEILPNSFYKILRKKKFENDRLEISEDAYSGYFETQDKYVFTYSDSTKKDFFWSRTEVSKDNFLTLFSIKQGSDSLGYYYERLNISDVQINEDSTNWNSYFKQRQKIRSRKILEDSKLVEKTLKVGAESPVFTGKPLQDTIRLENLIFSNHKLTLIDFWFRNCPPCIRTFPILDSIYTLYQNKGLQIYGANYQDRNDKPEELQRFLNIMKVKYPSYLISENIRDRFEVTNYPTFILVNQEGIIEGYYEGNYPEILANMKEKINEVMLK